MEAYRAFIEATEINPGYADGLVEKGSSGKTGKYSDAILAYEKSPQNRPEICQSLVNLRHRLSSGKKA